MGAVITLQSKAIDSEQQKMRQERALREISEIRQRLQLIDARSAIRCVSFYLSAFLFGIAAIYSPALTDESSASFVGFWFGVGCASAMMVVLEISWRCFSFGSRITVDWVRQMVACVTPSAVALTLATWALMSDITTAQLLPGLWAIFIGIALASAHRLLPVLSQVSCLWWVVGGAVALKYSTVCMQHTGWTMAILFGVGHLLLAISLFPGLKEQA